MYYCSICPHSSEDKNDQCARFITRASVNRLVIKRKPNGPFHLSILDRSHLRFCGSVEKDSKSRGSISVRVTAICLRWAEMLPKDAVRRINQETHLQLRDQERCIPAERYEVHWKWQ